MHDFEAREYLRVTEILYPFSGFSHVDEIILENAAVRGTRVHKICEGIIKGLGEWNIEPALEGYVESFKLWWDPSFEVVAQEKRFFCDELGITGQLDLLLRENDKLLVCDLKTSSQVSKTWAVQGSAYVYLARKAGYDVSGMKFIKLSRYGKPPLVSQYEPNIDLFFKCLEVYKYFFKNEEKRRSKTSPNKT